MLISRFEDVESWKEGRVLARSIYQISGRKSFRRDFALSYQMRRAVISITSNIAEGFESQTNAEFIRFLTIARRSSAEVKSQLYIAFDNEYIDLSEFEELYACATKIAKLINGFINHLKKQPSK